MNVVALAARQKLLLIAGVVIGLLGTAAMLLQPVMIGFLIADVSAGRSPAGAVVGISLLFLADAVLATVHMYLIGIAGENIVLDLRTTLTGRLLRSRLRAFDRLEHGDVMNRVLADTSLARLALSSSLAQMVTASFTVVGCVIAMAWLDWRLLLAALGCLAAASLGALALARAVRMAAVVNREDSSAYGSGLLRVLGALTTVKASCAEGREAEHLEELAAAARRSGLRVTRLSAMFLPAMNIGTQVSLAVVITWGVARSATGAMTLADLTAFVMYLFYLVSPLVMFFLGLGEVQQGRAAIGRVVDLADLEQEETTAPSPGDARRNAPGPSVEFRDVSFRYPDAGSPALDGVSFTLPRTGVTAIVGPSGAGKTTMFQLIERFHSTAAGSVALLGRDADDVPLTDWRARIGLVEQDSPLMRGTVRENLTYACPDADDDAMADALAAVHLTDVVAGLPAGLDTSLGEGGSGLSGGERQRLAAARALLARPDVLLLDEATSQLDSDAERALRDAVAAIGQRCQVITIAHRMSTAAQADQILVMQDGRLRAAGTHDELLRTDELYRRLATQQLAPAAMPA